MPKGEHFKKPNPRIIQVSFKVNQKEFDALQSLVKSKNTSVAQFFRSIIMGGEEKAIEVTPQPGPAPVKEEIPVPAPITNNVMPKPTRKKVEKKPAVAPKKEKEEDAPAPNQMSLF